jgi:hypothetical protein
VSNRLGPESVDATVTEERKDCRLLYIKLSDGFPGSSLLTIFKCTGPVGESGTEVSDDDIEVDCRGDQPMSDDDDDQNAQNSKFRLAVNSSSVILKDIQRYHLYPNHLLLLFELF